MRRIYALPLLLPLIVGTSVALSRTKPSTPPREPCSTINAFVAHEWQDGKSYYLTLISRPQNWRVYARIRDNKVGIWGLVQYGDYLKLNLCGGRDTYLSGFGFKSYVDLNP